MKKCHYDFENSHISCVKLLVLIGIQQGIQIHRKWFD